MSFILDALRKSDAERQRAVTPGLADVRYAARRQKRNVWLPILAVVLAANVVFMGVRWFTGRTATPAAPESSPARQVVAPAIVQEAAPAAGIRPLAREAEFGEPEPSAASAYAGAPPPAPAPVVVEAAEPTLAPPTARQIPVAAPVATEAQAPPQAAAPSPSRIVAGNELPTAEELIGSGVLNIPLLNLDLHVYSEKPARRFVVINSRKYNEGAPLAEGPTIESITKDGVILASQGRRFTLSRK